MLVVVVVVDVVVVVEVVVVDVVVVASGRLMICTGTAYVASFASKTMDRAEKTWVTLPTRPPALTTGMPTRSPSLDPWLISTVWEKFEGAPPTTWAVIDEISVRSSIPFNAKSSCASRAVANAAMKAPSC